MITIRLLNEKEIQQLEKRWGLGVRKALEKALRSESFRLKRELSSYMRRSPDWPALHPFSRAVRKYKRGGPGAWFARFTRYAVGWTRGGLKAEIGVLNPSASMRGRGGRPLSRMILAAASRFAGGHQETLSLKGQRAMVGRFLAAKRRRWSEMSPRQKRLWRRKLAKEGALFRVGTVLRTPARDLHDFAEREKPHIIRNVAWLFARAIKGERYSKTWWEEV